jgi:rSAM/selenodomain-associated transferase 1
MSTGIAVMAKAPRAGQCKTRLQPLLSPAQSAAISVAFLADITGNLALAARSAAIVPYVAFAPAGTEALFDGILAPATRLLLADGSLPAPDGVEKFGRCLLHALHAILAEGHEAAIVLNADSPTLPTRCLLAAHEILAAPGDRAVIGAAEDGGYYLLGVKKPHAALLKNIDWSTDRVAGQTRARAREAELPLFELETWYDVDDPQAFARLVGELSAPGGVSPAGAYAAPHTAARLAEMGFLKNADWMAGAAA